MGNAGAARTALAMQVRAKCKVPSVGGRVLVIAHTGLATGPSQPTLIAVIAR